MHLKPQDVMLLLAIAGRDTPWTLAEVGGALGLSPSAVHRGLARLDAADLFDSQARQVKAAQAHEFLVHALKYVFPPQMHGEARGIPTAWAAPPLDKRLAPARSLPPVWPHPLGKKRGIALEPLHPAVPGAARANSEFSERMALADALRIGDARLRRLAASEMKRRLIGAR
jgi:hypothetical protein